MIALHARSEALITNIPGEAEVNASKAITGEASDNTNEVTPKVEAVFVSFFFL
ncbi:MAG: hypothetical protein U0T11_03490 [Chitinophagaceae bacterium]